MRSDKLLLAVLAAAVLAPAAHGSDVPILKLEAEIPLPEVSGRIDHLAVDLTGKRLFIAELGNGSVGVVDLKTNKVVHRITDLREPQGVAYLAQAGLIVVASSADGTAKFFDGATYTLRGTVKLGDDADNVRLDPRDGTIVVGYGSGALAIIDSVTLKKTRDIALPAHPEGFQIAPTMSRIFVNVPDAREIAVVDSAAGGAAWHWKTQGLGANFPMALDEIGHALAVVFRSPARFVLFDAVSGNRTAEIASCGDADDVFFDAKRHRYYVTCGEGVIDVFDVSGAGLKKLAAIATGSGARTSLFVPELDRLFVAQRAGWLGAPAFLRVYHPGN